MTNSRSRDSKETYFFLNKNFTNFKIKKDSVRFGNNIKEALISIKQMVDIERSEKAVKEIKN